MSAIFLLSSAVFIGFLGAIGVEPLVKTIPVPWEAINIWVDSFFLTIIECLRLIQLVLAENTLQWFFAVIVPFILVKWAIGLYIDYKNATS